MSETQTQSIETHRLDDEDAAELELLAGCLVVRLAPTRGRPIWAHADKADQVASKLSRLHPGHLYGVFKLARDYHQPIHQEGQA